MLIQIMEGMYTHFNKRIHRRSCNSQISILPSRRLAFLFGHIWCFCSIQTHLSMPYGHIHSVMLWHRMSINICVCVCVRALCVWVCSMFVWCVTEKFIYALTAHSLVRVCGTVHVIQSFRRPVHAIRFFSYFAKANFVTSFKIGPISNFPMPLWLPIFLVRFCANRFEVWEDEGEENHFFLIVCILCIDSLIINNRGCRKQYQLFHLHLEQKHTAPKHCWKKNV